MSSLHDTLFCEKCNHHTCFHKNSQCLKSEMFVKPIRLAIFCKICNCPATGHTDAYCKFCKKTCMVEYNPNSTKNILFAKLIDTDSMKSDKVSSPFYKTIENEMWAISGQLYSSMYSKNQRFIYQVYNPKNLCKGVHKFMDEEKIFGKSVTWFILCSTCGSPSKQECLNQVKVLSIAICTGLIK